MKRTMRVAVVLAMIGSATVLSAQAASAATVGHVTNCNDSVPGSLRAAVASASLVVINTNCPVITLTSGAVTIGTDVTINGHGGQPAVDGNHKFGVFSVNPGVTATIKGLTIQNGQAAGTGGGINNSGTLTVMNSVLKGNSAIVVGCPPFCFSAGGGIFNGGTLTVMNSTLSGNAATGDPTTALIAGGGIVNFGGTVDVKNSTLTVNSTSGAGGAILTFGGTASVTNSLLSGNSALNGGGAISIVEASLTIMNSTLSGNSDGAGGAIRSELSTLTIRNSRVSGNSANVGGAEYQCGGSTTVGNSRFSANPDSTGVYFFPLTDSPPGVFYADPGCPPSTFTATNSTFS